MQTDPLYMLVDDNPIDLKVHSKMLKIAGITDRVVTCSNAKEGLAYLEDKTEGELPDVILLDIQMPEMNGFDFLDAFKQLPDTVKKQVKIFMLSTTMYQDDIKKAAVNPFVLDLLSKPLDTSLLKSHLSTN